MHGTESRSASAFSRRLELVEYRADQLVEAVRDGEVDVAPARLASMLPAR